MSGQGTRPVLLIPPCTRRQFLQRTALAATLTSAGCRLTREDSVSLPARHSVQADQLVVLSDFRLPYSHPLIKDLIQLRKDVSNTLALELADQPVVVYLFSSEKEYNRFLKETYPSLPHRRAYFMGTSWELSVYAGWGPNIQDDLRHEFTHGLLHSTLHNVPLWLDEGIAEYFEPAGSAGQIRPIPAAKLGEAVVNGWEPSLTRLESMTDVAEMGQADYRESWAWVHYLLHGSPDLKGVFYEYLQELKSGRNPGPLSARIDAAGPIYRERFPTFLMNLQTIQ